MARDILVPSNTTQSPTGRRHQQGMTASLTPRQSLRTISVALKLCFPAPLPASAQGTPLSYTRPPGLATYSVSCLLCITTAHPKKLIEILLQLGGFPNVKTMNVESSGPKPHLTGTCIFFLQPSQKQAFIYFFNPNVKPRETEYIFWVPPART